MTKHIHDCTGPDLTCACGYTIDKTRKPQDVIEDLIGCAEDFDGGRDDAKKYAQELYALAFQAGQHFELAALKAAGLLTPQWEDKKDER